MKKLFCALLALVLVAVGMPFSEAASSHTFTVSQSVTSFNGTRYTDYLVIYTVGGTTTGTNVWGTEAVVENGIVVTVGGNDSYIPLGDNSFVVSGHGAMKEWLDENVFIGMTCYYDADEMKVYFAYDELEAAFYSLDSNREQAHLMSDVATEGCYIYSFEADGRLASADAAYNSVKRSYENGSATLDAVTSLAEEYSVIADLYLEAEIAEYRGVWIRPTQKTAKQVDDYVQKCYDAGINMISVETMYECTTIMPMPEDSLFKHNPDFRGFDVLGAYIESCHKRGMELHVWMPVFYSGSTASSKYAYCPAAQKPSWRLLTNNGRALYSNESSGMVFLNPALDEVQEFLLSSYEYILTNYDIDAFQLDYIRYRDRIDTDDYGYDSTTIAKFKEAYPRYASRTITYNTRADYWDDWVAFRASFVTSFVEKMRNLIDEVAPHVLLTADVGALSSSSYSTLYQDSTSWIRSGWLDIIHPMAYGDGYGSYMDAFLETAGDRCMVVPGLGIFMEGFDAEDMRRQTKEMRDAGCDGVVFFQIAQYLSKNCGELLTDTVFKAPTLTPAFDNDATLESIIERIGNRLILVKQRYSDINFTEITKAYEALAAVQGRAGEAYDELEAYALSIENIGGTLGTRLKKDVRQARFAVIRDMRDATELMSTGCVNGDYILIAPDTDINSVAELIASSVITYETAGVVPKSVISNEFLSYTVLIKGDVDFDGLVNSVDYFMVKRAMLGTYTMSDESVLAGALSNGESLIAADYLKLKRYVLGTYTIE